MTYPLPPNAVDLTFDSPATAVAMNAVDLTFGATAGPAPGTVYAATLSGRFALRGSVTVNYNVAQWRGMSATTRLAHRQARAMAPAVAVVWQPGAQAQLLRSAVFGPGLAMGVSHAAAWQPALELRQTRALAWQAALASGMAQRVQWARPVATPQQRTLLWARGAERGTQVVARYGKALATPTQRLLPWAQGKATGHGVADRYGRKALARPSFVVAPWQQATALQSLGGARYLPPPRPPEPCVPVVAVDVRFCALYPDANRTTLVFGLNPCGGITPDAPVYILPARFYMAVHSIEAHLLPTLEPVPIFGVSLGADSGSFAWTFSATGPASLFDALAPTGGLPSSIRITLDGMQWVFVVDSVAATESFGQRGARISGRSATALVGNPYSREAARLNTTAQNAQQLAAQALAMTGVDLDWGLADWLVPAGAWSHMGTPLAAVQAIAEAAGGYVNSHRSAPTLLVRHPYPTLPGGIPGGPWNWAGGFAADVELAPSSLITRSIERRDGPDVDGVYVSGTSQGVLALVRRTGTQGAKLAPMVTEALVTANAAAQQRGLSVIGLGGAKHLVQISLPVLTGASQPGVLDVGQLVQVNDSTPWRGRVRSVGVQASMPSVRQTVALERHLA